MNEVLKQALELAHEGVAIHNENSPEYKVCAALIAIAELESQAQPKQVNELHTCPYRENLHGDYETLCACDEEATHQCLMDI